MQMDDGYMKQIDGDDIMHDTITAKMIEMNAELIFRVGEKVKIKGGDFVIKSFGSKQMVVEGIPGTRIKK